MPKRAHKYKVINPLKEYDNVATKGVILPTSNKNFLHSIYFKNFQLYPFLLFFFVHSCFLFFV